MFVQGFLDIVSALNVLPSICLTVSSLTSMVSFSAFTPQQLTLVKEWRKKDRFEKSSETDAVIQVKIQ